MTTAEQRSAALHELCASMPGSKKIHRIRAIADYLGCAEITVRIWLMKNPTRVIPAAKLKMLQREFANKKPKEAI